MPDKITAWSYSRYSEYKQCPFKIKCKVILKLKEPGNEAMDRGSTIHKKLENYLNGNDKKLPTEAKLLKKEYSALKKKVPQVEMEAAFNSKWESVDWFNYATWCRVKIDAITPPILNKDPTVIVDDHKTGKVKEHGEYDEQLELYGLTGLLLFPIAEKAKSRLLFVDSGDVVTGPEYQRKDIDKLKKKWEIRVKPMMTDTRFEATPGNYCRWCHFRKSNGGPCKY